MRQLHTVHLLIRDDLPDGRVGFLLAPHEHWTDPAGAPWMAMPTKKTVSDPVAEVLAGTPLDTYIDDIVQNELGVPADSYALEQELEAVDFTMGSPTHTEETAYRIYPIDVWVHSSAREPLRARTRGRWLTLDDAIADPRTSPTARAVFAALKERHQQLTSGPSRLPAGQSQAEALRRLLSPAAEYASMEAQARQWLGRNLRGVRHLPKRTLDAILEAGDRAFNLRVADPYLRFQMQGLGFTWSFFTHKDSQDCHVHGAPVVEIYGVLKGRLEVWWKPYYERGSSAWSHRVLEAGDWLEVDSLQCHIVRWLGEGKGVVFKAGPGPLAEVGKLGVKGKTPCKDCPCAKPPQVIELERR